MKQLFSAFYRKPEETDVHFERYLKGQIDWNNRLTTITGTRGTYSRKDFEEKFIICEQ